MFLKRKDSLLYEKSKSLLFFHVFAFDFFYHDFVSQDNHSIFRGGFGFTALFLFTYAYKLLFCKI